MDAFIGILSLLGIIVALIAAVTGMQRLNERHGFSPTEPKRGLGPWLLDIAKALPKILLATAAISAGLFALFVLVAMLPIANKEAVAGAIGLIVILAIVGYLKRWEWKSLRDVKSWLHPWEHPSAGYRPDDSSKK
jgi:amino acid transporter